MANNRVKYFDTHTLYVTSGVARVEQLYKSLRIAIKNGEENLYHEDLEKFISSNNININKDLESDNTVLLSDQNKQIVEKLVQLGHTPPEKKCLECKIRVNLIVSKNGDYFGFGYIHVSKEEVYWMLLGKNPDGTDRVLEYLDPDWVPPLPKPKLTAEEEEERFSSMKWYEIAEEEDKYIHPTIRQVLGPLMVLPGYEYDDMQYRHHQEIAKREGKDPSKVPLTGYFELSRAYARDVDPGKMHNVLCARQVPDWIPPVAFKQIFRDYASDNITQILVKGSNYNNSDTDNNNNDTNENENENDNISDNDDKNDNNDNKNDDNTGDSYDTYPFINLIDGKKETGRIVFITFDYNTKDAIFALLMTRKVTITHPKNPNLTCTLIFDHAYEKGRNQDRSDRSFSDRSDRSFSDRNKYDRSDRFDRTNRNNSDRNNSHRTNRNNSTDKNRNGSDKTNRIKPIPRDDIDISKYNYTKSRK